MLLGCRFIHRHFPAGAAQRKVCSGAAVRRLIDAESTALLVVWIEFTAVLVSSGSLVERAIAPRRKGFWSYRRKRSAVSTKRFVSARFLLSPHRTSTIVESLHQTINFTRIVGIVLCSIVCCRFAADFPYDANIRSAVGIPWSCNPSLVFGSLGYIFPRGAQPRGYSLGNFIS